MEDMNLHKVNQELTKLYNEQDYLHDRMAKILSLVTPKSGNLSDIKVDGGERVDKLLEYTQLKDELMLAERLKYVKDKILSLDNWRNAELERLNKFDDLIPKIVHLKEEVFIKDKWTGKLRHMTWKEISKDCYISERTARYKYNIGIEARNNKNSINVQETKKAR